MIWLRPKRRPGALWHCPTSRKHLWWRLLDWTWDSGDVSEYRIYVRGVGGESKTENNSTVGNKTFKFGRNCSWWRRKAAPLCQLFHNSPWKTTLEPPTVTIRNMPSKRNSKGSGRNKCRWDASIPKNIYRVQTSTDDYTSLLPKCILLAGNRAMSRYVSLPKGMGMAAYIR